MFDTLMSRDFPQTLDHFRRSVDQLFSDFYRSGSGLGSAVTNGDYAFTPAVESRWTDNELFLRAILPGVQEKEVKVSVQNNQLVIEVSGRPRRVGVTAATRKLRMVSSMAPFRFQMA